jgi:hypothetical protein
VATVRLRNAETNGWPDHRHGINAYRSGIEENREQSDCRLSKGRNEIVGLLDVIAIAVG